MTRRVDPKIEKVVGRKVSQYVRDTDGRYERERGLLLDDLDEVGLDILAVHEAAHEHYFHLSGKVKLNCGQLPLKWSVGVVLAEENNGRLEIQNHFSRQMEVMLMRCLMNSKNI